MNKILRPLVALENAINAYLAMSDWLVASTFFGGLAVVTLATCAIFGVSK